MTEGGMDKARAATRIERSADEVWAVIGDFGDLSWRLGVETCKGSGRLRTTTMQGMNVEMDEEELHRDEARRSYTYGMAAFRGDTVIKRPDGGTFDLCAMVGHLRATLTVEPIGAAASLINYDLEADDGFETLIPSTIAGYQAVLDHLKRQLEG
jgi:hypothetical protein